MDATIVFQYFPDLSDLQKRQFSQLGELYTHWNAQINIISRKDIEHLFVRHVLHSLAIAKYSPFPDGSRIIDVGTGGGFPGIPLAILFPLCEFLLVDSIAKKIRVVNEVATALRLQNVNTLADRAEKSGSKVDFVVSRAVAGSKQLYQWTAPLIQPSRTISTGLILLKGGDLKDELKELKKPHAIQDISEYFNDPFFETKKIVYIPV